MHLVHVGTLWCFQESQGFNMVKSLKSNEMIETGLDSFHSPAPISLWKQVVGKEPMRAVWNPQVGVAVSKDSQCACFIHVSWKSKALKSSTVRVQASFLHVNLKCWWLSGPNWDIRMLTLEATCSLIWWISHVKPWKGGVSAWKLRQHADSYVNWPKKTSLILLNLKLVYPCPTSLVDCIIHPAIDWTCFPSWNTSIVPQSYVKMMNFPWLSHICCVQKDKKNNNFAT